MYQRILVPFDGSETAAAAMPFASWFARSFGAKVDVVTVAPSRATLRGAMVKEVDDDDSGVTVMSPDSRAAVERAYSAAHAQAEGIAEKGVAALAGVTASPLVAAGDPAHAIISTAETDPDTVIVISTHGRSGPQRWALGSVTDDVIRHATTPVLVSAHASSDVNVTGIVVPLDGSDWAEHSLQHAVAIAKAINVPITLVRAVSVAVGYGFFEDGPTQYPELLSINEQLADEYLAVTAQRLESAGLANVETVMKDGPTDAAILDVLGDKADKLTVMTSHGRSGVARWMLGSVADRVIRNGAGPVFLAPAH